MTKIYTDTEQRIWVRTSSSDHTLSFLVHSQTKLPVTYKKLALYPQDSLDELFFSMESDDGTIHTLNLLSTKSSEPPVTVVSHISDVFKKLVERFTGQKQ